MKEDLKNIHDCFNLCVDSYAPYFRIPEDMISEMEDFYDYEGFGIDRSEVNGSFGVINGKLYFVFDGSIGIFDWINNFRFFPESVTPYNGINKKIKVHSGILNQYMLIRDFIHAETIDFIENGGNFTDIIITGHSLGGALAALASLDLEYNFGVSPLCVMMGAPKFGNKHFLRSFNNRVIRCYNYINGKDIVTKLPPFMYKHVGEKIKMGKCDFGISIREHEPLKYLKYFEKKFMVKEGITRE